jgi:hypothetical protein
VIPLFDAIPQRPDWQHWQQYYLDRPEDYPPNGYSPAGPAVVAISRNTQQFSGTFHCDGSQDYQLVTPEGTHRLVTLHPTLDRRLQTYPHQQRISGWGRWNAAGNWWCVEGISS